MNFFNKSVQKILSDKSFDNKQFNPIGSFNEKNVPGLNPISSFNSYKPKKQFTLANKPVQVFNNNPIPKKSIIENVYKQIPDDTNVPLQFMSRKQYYEMYVKNQEHLNGKPFNKEQKQHFFKGAKKRYSNIIGRYTTENNPYYPPAVVVFNDKSNFNNIKGQKFKDLAWHEFGHEYVEDKGWDMCPLKEEIFADKLAANKRLQNQIKRDINSKNDKILYPKRLEEKGITFESQVTPREKRVLIKQLRRYPETIKKVTPEYPVQIKTDRTRDDLEAFGTLRPTDMETGKTKELVLDVSKELLYSKYDPDFITYVKENKPYLLNDKEGLFQESLKFDKARQSIIRTVGHEFQHANQFIDSKQPDWINFMEKTYQTNPYYYEKDANRQGKILSEKYKDYNIVEREIDEGEAQDKLQYINKDWQSKNKIKYRGETFPGYNMPKKYEGKQQYKKRVLAKDGDRIGIVNFGDKNYSDYTIHKDYDRMKNFRARHRCDEGKKDKLTAKYWSCENLWPNIKLD